ncbi:pentatricopeptide repeat-containing protein At2g13600 [Selaginella moellendorffii]|uniref:pentatricopeptide repeat-containing protein At2g13600 n=1 Tax=Selaginella moellendorffii TaxID=88036 RepID=UPI000D1C9031|nr:pentatricopeptide repeat-containing protein At2g13600 [Selaginella moellendorffii]|eukprot:XP_024533728.1 pentatricopeptide repeat-containing protein At2g13600 [Selaginella moellendorffii]
MLSRNNLVDVCHEKTERRSYEALLSQCKSITTGRKLHQSLLEAGYLSQSDSFFANLLIRMYGRCNSISDAKNIFDSISKRSVFSWTIMLAAYAQNGHIREARDIFDKMPSTLKNVVSWNSMISAYSQAGNSKEAFCIFKLMDQEGIRPNEITLISILDGFSSCNALEQGKSVHKSIDSTFILCDVRVGTALVDMYGKCGDIGEAKAMFDAMRTKNEVTWNAMMAAYAQNGHSNLAIRLFQLMSVEGVKPDDANFVSVLEACGDAGDLTVGRLIHSFATQSGYESNLMVATSLLNMYSRSREFDRAREIFDSAESKDVVLWTALLVAYVQSGHGKEGFRVFVCMDLEGFTLDEACFISALDACGSVLAVNEGKLVHASLLSDYKYYLSTKIQNALVHMYGQCGHLREARKIFEDMRSRDKVSWNGILTAYARHGQIHDTLDLFLRMNLEGIPPNAITFTNVLSACSHAGKLSKAMFFLASMQGDHGVCLEKDHYACAVDLLGRLGQLHEAEALTDGISSGIGWMAYLSACKAHGNVEAAARAADRVLKLDPENSAPYVLFSSTQGASKNLESF